MGHGGVLDRHLVGIELGRVDVGIDAVVGEVAHAGRQAGAILLGVATAGNAELGAAADAVVGLLGDDVDHAGDRVGAVAGRCAVAQHVDPLDDVVGDRVEVDEVTRTVVGQRIVSRAKAVEQDERRVGRKAAQRDCRCTAGERAVGGEAVGQGRAVVRGQALQAFLDRRDTALFERFGGDRGHRRRSGSEGVAKDRPGNDDRLLTTRRRNRRAAGDRRLVRLILGRSLRARLVDDLTLVLGFAGWRGGRLRPGSRGNNRLSKSRRRESHTRDNRGREERPLHKFRHYLLPKRRDVRPQNRKGRGFTRPYDLAFGATPVGL